VPKVTQRPSESAIGLVLRLLSPRIAIRVSPDSFVLSTATNSVQIRTFMYLDLAHPTGAPRVLAVGEDVAASSDIRRVDLFRDDAPLPEGIDRMICLEAFCRFGVQRSSRARDSFVLL